MIKGFDGTREDLTRAMEEPEFMLALAAARMHRPAFGDGTLGGLIEWCKSDTVRWARLRDATKADYEKSFAWIGADLHYAVDAITGADIANLRNRAAKAKWPRFADKLVGALSMVFSEAVEVGKVKINPCIGIKRLHAADPNKNREWTAEEQKVVFEAAPRHILTPMLIARHAGPRGSDIQPLKWSAYAGRRLAFTAAKNSESVNIPVPASEPLAQHLDTIERTSIFICTTRNDKPWKRETTLQGAVSRFLRKMEREGKVAPGLTLHGLRVTFAAEWKRLGADDSTIAELLGDKSTSMGKHYTRHVSRQDIVDRAFALKGFVQK
ncbi:MAG: tyrosine-type recombinase/integrase [Nitratireductor sp.]|nr:tyrosine-type recombinase/integrase [Nitratireductor sp.]